jgi:hypothetical protein
MKNKNPFGGRSLDAHFSQIISFNMNGQNIGGRSWGKTATTYSKIIESGDYPNAVNSFQKDEITKMWAAGNTYGAIQKLQSILEPITKPGKTLL